MKSEEYEVADLNSIIKSRQSYTPRSSGARPVEPQPQASSEQDYHSLKSQYTTNYVSVQHPPVKSVRALRQEVNFIRNEQHPGEFIVYCIVVKESNLGIYSNERLLLFDSQAKILSYYSQVPTLPITDPAALPSPKETVRVASVKKFSYLPAKNGIGEVLISWIEGEGLKEWRITMSSRRVAKEFGIVIEQVLNNQHHTKRTVESARKIEPVAENKVNKKQTPFINQLKKLEQQGKNKPKTPKTSLKSDQMMLNHGSEVRFTQVIASRTPPATPVTHPLHEQPPQQTTTLQPKVQKVQEYVPALPEVATAAEQEAATFKPEIAQPAAGPPDTSQRQKQSEKNQIKMEDIIRQAEVQHTYISTIRSPQSETKRFAELQNILNNRKVKQKYYRSSLNSHDGNRLSQKKAFVQKIEQVTAESLLTNSRKDEEKESPRVAQKRHSRYEDNYNSFRMSLLHERRQANNQKGAQRGQPKRQSGRPKSNSLFEAAKTDNWLSRWIQAESKEQLAVIYCNFISECQIRVRKLISNCENWHLLHKAGSEFQFQEAEINFHYMIFRENENNQALFRMEEEFTTKVSNWSYLLNFIHEERKVLFRVPLACVVTYKGLKVLCKAALNTSKIVCSLIEDITSYVQPLRGLEEQCKIALHRCELYEVILKDAKYIYFNELDALPRLKAGELVGSNYISLFIKEGVIRNQLDLQEITRHITDKLMNKFLERLNATHLLSTVELDELLGIYGMNSSFLGELYVRAKANRQQQAVMYLLSELAAMGLAESIRLGVHRHLLDERKDFTAQTAYSVIQLFLQANLLLLEEIAVRMGLMFKQTIELQFKDLITPYVVSSALIKLGIRCDFRNKLPLEQLEDLSIGIWSSIIFTSEHVNLYFVSSIKSFNYRNFMNSHLLDQNIFKKRAELPEDLNKEKILHEINPEGKQPYSSCDRFRLLPALLKSRLNFYLAHYSPPNNRNLGLSFDLQHTELYFTLYQHSSAYLQTHEGFAEDLIGIKWLIKRGRYEEADCKLAEQRLRVWLWGRHHPQVLMEIYDLDSLYALKRGHLTVSAERSLTALQLAIHFFGESDPHWQLIWEKAFFSADVHYQSGRFDQASALYGICDSLNERIRAEELSADSINEQFLEVYNKKAVILLSEGRIDECIQYLVLTLEKLKAWKIYFSEKGTASMLIKVDSELFDAYRLLLRNYEIKQQYASYGAVLSEVLHTYFQKDWNPLYLNNPKLKLTDATKLRLSELIKDVWLYINKNIESINAELTKLQKPQIKQQAIYQHLEIIRSENKGFYRYTTQELFKYLVELVISRTDTENSFSQIEKSRITAMIIECLSSLSRKEAEHKRFRLYEESSKHNKLLLLQSVTHLAGYEFCMGLLQECFSSFNF